MGYLIILIAIFALMWLLLIRPQRRRAAEQVQLQDDVAVDDEVITAGGIHGTVKSLDDDLVHVEIAPGTTIRLDRRAIAAVAHEPEPEEPEEAEELEGPAEEPEEPAAEAGREQISSRES